jgi:hypothetical protein
MLCTCFVLPQFAAIDRKINQQAQAFAVDPIAPSFAVHDMSRESF